MSCPGISTGVRTIGQTGQSALQNISPKRTWRRIRKRLAFDDLTSLCLRTFALQLYCPGRDKHQDPWKALQLIPVLLVGEWRWVMVLGGWWWWVTVRNGWSPSPITFTFAEGCGVPDWMCGGPAKEVSNLPLVGFKPNPSKPIHPCQDRFLVWLSDWEAVSLLVCDWGQGFCIPLRNVSPAKRLQGVGVGRWVYCVGLFCTQRQQTTEQKE